MSENRDNGGPAFPFVDSASPHEHQGMSLRDYFATEVCASLLTATSADHDYPNLGYQKEDGGPTAAQRVAKLSYQMADAMLEARK
jgi:hypothetical protein